MRTRNRSASSSLRRIAASRAAAGSMISRTSETSRMTSAIGPWSSIHPSTSGSRTSQDTRGSGTVPTLGRDRRRPFEASTFVASRTTVRETPSRLPSSDSIGSGTPSGSSPDTMAIPRSVTAWWCSNVRRRGDACGREDRQIVRRRTWSVDECLRHPSLPAVVVEAQHVLGPVRMVRQRIPVEVDTEARFAAHLHTPIRRRRSASPTTMSRVQDSLKSSNDSR